MLKVRKILCPTDFSEASYKALELACGYADHFAADLILVHAVAPVPTAAVGAQPPMVFDINEYENHLVESSEERIKKIAQEKVPGDISVTTHILRGDPADEILTAADKENADLIVIATHGHSRIGELLFGSVAEKVIRHSKLPVLSVRSEK